MTTLFIEFTTIDHNPTYLFYSFLPLFDTLFPQDLAMRLWWSYLLAYLAIVQLRLSHVSGTDWGIRQPRHHLPVLGKESKQLVDASNASAICGLPLLTKGNRKHVVAGKKYMLAAKLTNNVNMVFDDVVVQFTLPRGANYRSARIFPKLDYGNKPSLENQGTLVIWRDVHMKSKQSRYFKVAVGIACNTTTPLTFRVYATVKGAGWIVGPVIQVSQQRADRSDEA